MSEAVAEIFVKLLDEPIDVWRPVQARRAQDGIYTILPQPYDREIERWQFDPGAQVVCELIESADGPLLAAIRRS